MTQRFYFSSFLLLTAILSGWLVWRYVVDTSWEDSANPNNPDSFVNNFEVIVMNAEGHREYHFTSPHLLHYAENDRTTFTLPHLLLYEDNAPPWTLNATQGEAIHGQTQITLLGNVTMTQPKGSANLPTDIKTEKAVIYSKEKLITTDQFISAIQPNASAQGVGMKLDMNHHTLDLLSQVKGTYVQVKK
jgi:lipopolysaccharide export system protein LptC